MNPHITAVYDNRDTHAEREDVKIHELETLMHTKGVTLEHAIHQEFD